MSNELDYDCAWVIAYTILELKFPKSTIVDVPVLKILSEADGLHDLNKQVVVCLGCSVLLLKQLRYLTIDIEVLAETFALPKAKKIERRKSFDFDFFRVYFI